MPRLQAYAAFKCRRLFWAGIYGGPLPGGREPEDIVNQAIKKLFSGERSWDPNVEPDLEKHLQSIIDSEINHLATGWENRHIRPESTLSPVDEGIPPSSKLENLPSAKVEWVDPIIESEQLHESSEFLDEALVALGDDPLLCSIVKCIAQGKTRPGEISADLGIEITEVYNARKKLRRRLFDLYSQWSKRKNQDEQTGGG